MLVVEHLGESSLFIVLVVAGLALASVRAAESLFSRARSKADARLGLSLAGRLRALDATPPSTAGAPSRPAEGAALQQSPADARAPLPESPDSESHRP